MSDKWNGLECDCVGPHTEACQDERLEKAERERDENHEIALENLGHANRLQRLLDEALADNLVLARQRDRAREALDATGANGKDALHNAIKNTDEYLQAMKERAGDE